MDFSKKEEVVVIGTITTDGKIDTKQNFFLDIKTKEECEINAEFNLNLMRGDRIAGHGELLEEHPRKKYYMTSKPAVRFANSAEHIKSYIDKSLEYVIRKGRASKVDAIFEALINHYRESNLTTDSGELVDFHLKRLSEDHRHTGMAGILNSLIKPLECKKLLRWWFTNRIMRYLEFYGINYTQMREIGLPSLNLIEIIKTNPIIIPEITMENVLVISEAHGIVYNPLQQKCGQILRSVYHHCRINNCSYQRLDYLAVSYPDIEEYKEDLEELYQLYFDEDRVYVKKIYDLECRVSKHITDNIKLQTIVKDDDATLIMDGLDKTILNDLQKEGARLIIKHRITVISGPAGTGKTTMIRPLVDILYNQLKYECIFVSFTGKAVSKLKQTLKGTIPPEKITTIHYFLADLTENKRHPDFVFIDEMSMVGMRLFNMFISSIRGSHHICFIGDHHQLPPINDIPMMRSLVLSKLPGVALTKVHRVDSHQSGIYQNANSVRNSDIDNIKSYPDFVFQETGIIGMRQLIYKLNDGGITFDRMLVLSPYNNPLIDLNKIFRDKNNEIAVQDDVKRGAGPKYNWKVGDRVILTKNCYEINVMNGDEGYITHVDVPTRLLTVKFEDNNIVKFATWDVPTDWDKYTDEEDKIDKTRLTTRYLQHSYALTIHKSQGSERDIVFIYLPKMQTLGTFLDRGLIYTAMTRAKKLLFIFTSPQYFIEALNNERINSDIHLRDRIDIEFNHQELITRI